MPALSNPRHERFARHFMKCGVASEAYRKAGYKSDNPKSVWANAARMIGHDSVQRRLNELRKQMASRGRITVDSLVEELDEAKALALRIDQPSAAISAITTKAKLVGLMVDRKEQGAPGDFNTASEAQTLELVRAELGDSAAATLAQALAKLDHEEATPAEAALGDVDAPAVEPTNEGSSTLN